MIISQSSVSSTLESRHRKWGKLWTTTYTTILPGTRSGWGPGPKSPWTDIFAPRGGHSAENFLFLCMSLFYMKCCFTEKISAQKNFVKNVFLISNLSHCQNPCTKRKVGRNAASTANLFHYENHLTKKNVVKNAASAANVKFTLICVQRHFISTTSIGGGEYCRAINFYRRETFTIYEKSSIFDGQENRMIKKLSHLLKY